LAGSAARAMAGKSNRARHRHDMGETILNNRTRKTGWGKWKWAIWREVYDYFGEGGVF
jgi:hypothetical protein